MSHDLDEPLNQSYELIRGTEARDASEREEVERISDRSDPAAEDFRRFAEALAGRLPD